MGDKKSNQFYRENSGYGRRFHQDFQAAPREEDRMSNQREEESTHQSNFAETEEKVETSPCYFLGKDWERDE